MGALVRNSTLRQMGNARSLAQRENLEDIAERQNWLIRWYDEEGTSGADLAKRRVGSQLLADIKAGVVQHFGVEDVKRASRDRDMIDLGLIVRALRERGGLFATPKRIYNPRNKADARMLRLEGLFAGMDWEDIRDQMWTGRMRTLRDRPLIFGHVPYGYRLVYDTDRKGAGTLVKDEAQGAILLRLAEELDKRRSIRAAVKAIGEPALTLHKVAGIIRNPLYWGEYVYGRQRVSDVWEGHTEVRHDVPDLAYWERGRALVWQAKFRPNNGGRQRRHRQYEHPFLGRIMCIGCRRPMAGGGAFGYGCQRPDCPAPQFISERVLVRLLEPHLPELLNDQRALLEATLRQTAPRVSTVAAELALLDAQEDEALKLLAKVKTERLQARLEAIQAERDRLRVLEAQQARQAEIDDRRRFLLKRLVSTPSVVAHYQKATDQEKAALLAELVGRVVVEASGHGTGRTFRVVELEGGNSVSAESSRSGA